MKNIKNIKKEIKQIAEKEKALINELHESIHRVETLRRNISGVYDCFRK